MHEDFIKFREICKSLNEDGISSESIAKEISLAPNYLYTLLKDDFQGKAFRASTLAKMQDFIKKHALNDLHFNKAKREVKPRIRKNEDEEIPNVLLRDADKSVTFGEHLDQALHLCPPTYKFRIVLERIP
jgi:hypothetical protein